MRNLIILLVGLMALAIFGFADAYGKTTADMYMESYMATMRRQTGASAAEIRADQYRSMHEVCDEHHNCTNVIVGKTERSVEKAEEKKSQTEPRQPFIHVPVWM